jgi:hypothetical protein
MLRAGVVLLSIWAGANLAAAALILVLVAAFGAQPPLATMAFSDAELAALPGSVHAAFRALCILYNAARTGLSLVALAVIWKGLSKGQAWAFWVIAVAAFVLQAFGFVADAAIGTKALVPNLVITAVYVAGLALAGAALLRPTAAALREVDAAKRLGAAGR